MAAPKTKTATNTNHPLRARFDLRDVIDQSLILGEDFQRMFVTTLATFSQRHAASVTNAGVCPSVAAAALKLPLWTISTSTCKSLAKGQLFSIVNYPQL